MGAGHHSVRNTTSTVADVSIIITLLGKGVRIVSPASPTGLTTACFGTGSLPFYTIPNVAPNALATITFDFTGFGQTSFPYYANGLVGPGPR